MEVKECKWQKRERERGENRTSDEQERNKDEET